MVDENSEKSSVAQENTTNHLFDEESETDSLSVDTLTKDLPPEESEQVSGSELAKPQLEPVLKPSDEPESIVYTIEPDLDSGSEQNLDYGNYNTKWLKLTMLETILNDWTF